MREQEKKLEQQADEILRHDAEGQGLSWQEYADKYHILPTRKKD